MWNILHPSFPLCCQASASKAGTSRDTLTGLPYMRKLCTLTHNALSDEKKRRIYREASAADGTSLSSLSSLLSMYALSWRSFPADMSSARVLCIHHFSKLENLRENSAINSSSPVGNTRLCQIAGLSAT